MSAGKTSIRPCAMSKRPIRLRDTASNRRCRARCQAPTECNGPAVGLAFWPRLKMLAPCARARRAFDALLETGDHGLRRAGARDQPEPYPAQCDVTAGTLSLTRDDSAWLDCRARDSLPGVLTFSSWLSSLAQARHC